jgi:hypothetical protein
VATLPEAGQCFGQNAQSSAVADVPPDLAVEVRQSPILLQNEVIGGFL